MIAQETTFLKAFGVFQKIREFLQGASRESLRLDEVERVVQAYLAEEGLAFLQEYVEGAGDGDEGETVTVEGRVLHRSEAPHRRRYLSIFGEMAIFRYVYSAGEKKPIEYAPLDAHLGFPAGEISYVLEDYQERLCVKSPFAKSAEDLKAILGTAVSVGTAERLNQQMANYAQSYQLSALTEENTPAPEAEGELLVVAADGKGVVMRRTLEQRLKEERESVAATTCDEPSGEKARPPSSDDSGSISSGASADRKDSHRRVRKERGRRRQALLRAQASQRSHAKKKGDSNAKDSQGGPKKSRKQMAYVGAVYTIDRFRRTADHVLDEVARRRREKERPRPQHKRVWGEMTRLQEGELLNGRSLLFVNLAVDCHLRDPERKKKLICLMDGEEPLWVAKQEWLERGIEILDFFHAMEHLWKVARQFHQGRAVEKFVEHHARMLLEGKVDYAVRNFGRLMRKRKLRGKKKKEVKRAIKYFRHNRHRMRYDEYLARGYPIGSGVAEGTCRNLVKDRMELTGMKWEHLGAQAMVYTRALYLNQEWDQFVNYRIEKEQERLYGKDTVYSKLTPYGQAV
jgi:hypothetical protein